ncbi:MAG: DUF4924 family protein [Porphyromonas sp.]|nr:DUF4924 family protein [Porphyromonas sp.]
MIVAEQKRKENVAEYILYMWQIEDTIRALDFDDKKIIEYVNDGYRLEKSMMDKVLYWYLDLADQMKKQGITKTGHLQNINELMDELQELSGKLLREPSQTLYSSVYFQTLPGIIQLRELSGGEAMSEVETCFVGIYGYLTLKARGEEVTDATTKAIKQFSTFLAMLADKFRDIEEGKLTLSSNEEDEA